MFLAEHDIQQALPIHSCGLERPALCGRPSSIPTPRSSRKPVWASWMAYPLTMRRRKPMRHLSLGIIALAALALGTLVLPDALGQAAKKSGIRTHDARTRRRANIDVLKLDMNFPSARGGLFLLAIFCTCRRFSAICESIERLRTKSKRPIDSSVESF